MRMIVSVGPLFMASMLLACSSNGGRSGQEQAAFAVVLGEGGGALEFGLGFGVAP